MLENQVILKKYLQKQKIVEEYSKDFETYEKDPEEALDLTDGIRDTFKGIPESTEEEFEHLTGIRLEKKVF